MDENSPPLKRDRSIITAEITSARDQLHILMPQHKEVIRILVAIFTASGGEALAHNKNKPVEEHVKPTQITTMDELLNQLKKQMPTSTDENAKITLDGVQQWFMAFNELMDNKDTKPLMLKMTNLYHEQVGAPPLNEMQLKLATSALFITTLKNHFSFNF